MSGPTTPPAVITPPSYWQPTIYYNSPVTMAPGGNGQLLIGYADGHVYSFNPKQQAVTLLDELSVFDDGMLWMVGGFSNQRIAAYDPTDSQTVVANWISDTEAVTEDSSAVIEHAIWDFDLPEQTKMLDGIIVVCDVPEGGSNVHHLLPDRPVRNVGVAPCHHRYGDGSPPLHSRVRLHGYGEVLDASDSHQHLVFVYYGAFFVVEGLLRYRSGAGGGLLRDVRGAREAPRREAQPAHLEAPGQGRRAARLPLDYLP
jgi:hypothetical protein